MEVDTLDKAKFRLLMTGIRKCLPQNGIVFLENRRCITKLELTESLKACMSMRMEGNFMKIPGQKQERKNDHYNKQGNCHKDNAGGRSDPKPACIHCQQSWTQE